MKRIITKPKQTTAIKPVCTVYLYTNEETQGLDTAPEKITEELIKNHERIKGASLYEIGVFFKDDVRKVEKRFGIIK